MSFEYRGRGGRGRGGDRGGRGRGRGDFGGRGRGAGRGRGRGASSDPPPVSGPPPKFEPVADNGELQLTRIRDLEKDGYNQAASFLLRPDFGSRGEKAMVGTNSIVYDVKGIKIYQYPVSFGKDLEAKKALRVDLMNNILSQLIKENTKLTKQIGHDHNDNVLSFVPLPVTGRQWIAYEAITGEGKEYPVAFGKSIELDTTTLLNQVSLKSLKDINADVTPVIHSLDVLLTSGIVASSSTAVKLSANKVMVVDKYAGSNDIDRGLYLCTGFFASVRPSFDRVLINIKRSAAAFYKAHNRDGSPMNFLDYASDYFGTTDIKAMVDLVVRNRNFFIGIKVLRTHLKHSRPKAIFGIAQDSANSKRFKTDDGKQYTVNQWFSEKYGLKLKAPNFPLLHLGGTTYLPAECAIIQPAQVFKGKVTDTTTMLNFTKRPALDTAKILAYDFLPQITNNGANKRINKHMLLVPSRILPAPAIAYKNKVITASPADPSHKGAWNLKGCKFMVEGKAKKNCGFIVITDRFVELNSNMKDALKAFYQEVKNCGINFTGYAVYEVAQSGNSAQALQQLEDDVVKACRKFTDCNYVLVVLPQRNGPIYEAVKRATDLRAGMNSNCAVANKVTKKRGPDYDRAYFANIAMKVNLKLGGSNHVLGKGAELPPDTMLMGADVTHPSNISPGKTEQAVSVAAVVGSHDKWYSNFPGSLRNQKGKQEMIEELKEMCMERLEYYFKRNKKLPSHVLFYRDGVSESQFSQVIEKELSQIKSAVADAHQKWGFGPTLPKVTLVTTVKRTNARFFPHDEKTSEGNPATAMDNCLAGSTIDRVVTSSYMFDFFIQSQQLPQRGTTAAPCHYYVLHDEFGYTSNQIQKVTYDLCHIFSRATRSVKLCPPAYYSDLLCTRGRCYLKSDGRAQSLKVSPGVENTMFYI